MATNDIKPSSSLPAVLEDITKRELDRPRTRRDIFDLAKKAIQIGGGSALDRSKIGDWIIGDESLPTSTVPIDIVPHLRELNDLWMDYNNIEEHLNWAEGNFIEEEGWESLKDVMPLPAYEGQIPDANEINYAFETHNVNVDMLTDDLKEELKKQYDPEVAEFMTNVIVTDVYDYGAYDIDDEIHTLEDVQDMQKSLINYAEKEYKRYKATGEEYSPRWAEADPEETSKKSIKDQEKKKKQLIKETADLVRRLAAPPTGTVPKGRQVKPPVQEPKPTQPKIPALEQPTEQGKGLSNLARMLPAVGRKLPYAAIPAALLKSKTIGPEAPIPTSLVGDIDPRAITGAGLDIPRKEGGRVYRNYYDYNPRNI